MAMTSAVPIAADWGNNPFVMPRRTRRVTRANPWSAAGRATPRDKKATGIENLVRYALLRYDIFFLEQQQLGPYWPDFYLPDLIFPGFPKGTVIEADGAFWHGTKAAKARDARKDRWYRENGYFVYRWDEWHIQQDTDRLVKGMLLDHQTESVACECGESE